MTAQRRLVLEELRAVSTHPTADELYSRVRDKMKNISLATVYRALRWLERRGLVRVIRQGGPARYDGRVQRHYHVRCRVCGRVGDVEIAEAVEVMERAAAATDYKIEEHELFFRGVCPACQAEHGV